MSNAKDLIFGAADVKVEKVNVPEWPVPVFVRVMSGKSRDVFESAVMSRKTEGGGMSTSGIRALMVALTACDESGTLYFTESDIPAIEEKSADVLQRIFDAATEINAISTASAEKAKSDFTNARA